MRCAPFVLVHTDARDLLRSCNVVSYKHEKFDMRKEIVMKRIFYILILLAMNAAICAGPVQAEDSGLNDSGLKGDKGYTGECLLVAINCGTDYVSLEKKIDSLQKEISKGRAAYTDDELRILKQRLDNANKTLEYFKHEGAGSWYTYPGE